jgi:hypothetical protein
MAKKRAPSPARRVPSRSAGTRRSPSKGVAKAKKAGVTAQRRKGARGRHRSSARVITKAGGVTVTEIAELQALRAELEKAAASTGSPLRWNADPDDVQRSVAHLVLTLVEFIRRLLERQAIRRMEGGSLTDTQIEDVGTALMKLEETVRDIAAKFGIQPEELNLDLGPVGKLM